MGRVKVVMGVRVSRLSRVGGDDDVGATAQGLSADISTIDCSQDSANAARLHGVTDIKRVKAGGG